MMVQTVPECGRKGHGRNTMKRNVALRTLVNLSFAAVLAAVCQKPTGNVARTRRGTMGLPTGGRWSEWDLGRVWAY